MAQQTLGRTKQQLKFKSGLAANVNATATKNLAVEGEPHWATDTGQLYMFDGTQNVHVPTMDENDEYVSDFGFATDDIGVVLIDRTTATKYRLFVDSGVLSIEAV